MDPVTPGAPERLAVSVTEAARMVGIGRTLAYQLIAEDRFPHHRFQGRIVVPLAQLRAFIDGGGPTQGEG